MEVHPRLRSDARREAGRALRAASPTRAPAAPPPSSPVADLRLQQGGRTEDAQKILSTVQHSGERFGAAHVIDILRGTETEKIVRFSHGRLPVFGVGAGRGKNEWRSLIRQMVATGFLRLDIAGYGGLGITDKGRDLLRGKGAFRYREDTVAARPSAPSRETRGKEPEHPLSGDQTTLLEPC